MKKNKAVFLDRDGTINKNFGYVFQKEKFIFLKNAINAIKFLKNNGYKVIVVTNQSGVARGFFKLEDVKKLHDWVNLKLKKKGVKIDKFYVSTYHPRFSKQKNQSHLRKPNPGMLIKAQKDFSIDFSQSFMIGDSKSDKLAAKKVNLIFIRKKQNLLACAKQGLKRILKT